MQKGLRGALKQKGHREVAFGGNAFQRGLLHRKHATSALNRLRNMSLLGSIQTGQLAWQNLASLSDIAGQGFGLCEVEVMRVFGPIRITFCSHGRV
jgi:hypothetical protein